MVLSYEAGGTTSANSIVLIHLLCNKDSASDPTYLYDDNSNFVFFMKTPYACPSAAASQGGMSGFGIFMLMYQSIYHIPTYDFSITWSKRACVCVN